MSTPFGRAAAENFVDCLIERRRDGAGLGGGHLLAEAGFHGDGQVADDVLARTAK